MKTTLIMILLGLLSTGVPAKTAGDGFVVANGITYFCQSFKIGLINTCIVTLTGDMVKVPNSHVQAYQLNGRQYELLPLVNASGDTIDLAFMEFISMRNGSRLYRYCSNCCKYDPLNGEIAPLNRVYRYYVLKNGELRLLSDNHETGKILASFNVRVINDRSRM